MAPEKSIRLPLFLLAVLCIQLAHVLCYSMPCPAGDRRALVELTASAVDPAGRLSSWTGQDCCRWDGIRCDNLTGHVVTVDLRNHHQYYDTSVGHFIGNSSWALQCESLSSSLLALKHLRYLDLSGNYFNSSSVPRFLGSFRELRYLNLSFTDFHGTIPHQLGNLSKLHTLSLQVDNPQEDEEEPTMRLVLDDDHRWLTSLTSLNILEVRYANLASGWMQALNTLPSMSEIRVTCSVPTGDSSLSLSHVNFTSLSVLDLSGNNWESPSSTSGILGSLPNLTSLQYLDLSDNNLQAVLPAAIWNMSSLNVLILSGNQFEGSFPESAGNSLRQLQRLELSGNSLSGHLPSSLGSLQRLNYLDLSFNSLSGSLPASIGNLSQLWKLDLSYNGISRQLPDSIGNLRNLQWLDMSSNALTGPLPMSITNLRSLQNLLLDENSLSGLIPHSLGKLSSLQKLGLSGNELNGDIPESLGQLSHLSWLDLGDNYLRGVVTQAHFAGLNSLQHLGLSNNSEIVLNTSSGWRPPFKLTDILLRGCKLGPQFPYWLHALSNISMLDLSNTGISDSIPDWFWKNKFLYLDLSHNSIHGTLPSSLLGPLRSHVTIVLRSNRLEGPLPTNIQNMDLLDLSDNLFSGPVPQQIWKTSPEMRYLLLSNNNLNGTVPSSFCKLGLFILDLSENQLTGELPNCRHQNGYIFDLSYNHLSGGIPDEFLNSTFLHSLYLSNNRFTGEVPSGITSLCQYLSILDLGNNNFSGNVPVWLDGSFTSLRVLRLRSNKLDGYLPGSLFQLQNLQILDLSHNKLSGVLPPSLGNFTAMMRQNEEEYDTFTEAFTNKVVLGIKGRDVEYAKLLKFLAAVDLSGNNLSGAIPEELANLTRLQCLNLSGNHLTGEMSAWIGRMQQLESLDLSRNDLSGPLPSALANLSSLGFLNVSYNNFSGIIPSGGHLDTLNDPSIYMGNPYLYGIGPGGKNNNHQIGQGPSAAASSDGDQNADYGNDMVWFYISLAPGFAVGFWTVFGVLVIRKEWRFAYFRAIDNTCDKFYVITILSLRKFKTSYS